MLEELLVGGAVGVGGPQRLDPRLGLGSGLGLGLGFGFGLGLGPERLDPRLGLGLGLGLGSGLGLGLGLGLGFGLGPECLDPAVLVDEEAADGILQREAQVEAHDLLVDGAEARYVGEADLVRVRVRVRVRLKLRVRVRVRVRLGLGSGSGARPTSMTHASRTTQSWKKGSAASCLGSPTKVHSSPTSRGSAEMAAATTPQ